MGSAVLSARVKPRLLTVCEIPEHFLTPDFARRFWAKVQDRDDGCQVWTGWRLKGRWPAGRVEVLCRREGVRYREYAHRVAWMLAGRALPELPISLLHTCINAACVNVDHLVIGTYLDNGRNTSRKGHCYRQDAVSCLRGHSLTDESNIYWKPGPQRAQRQCRICTIEDALSRYAQDPKHWNQLVQARRAKQRASLAVA